MRVFHTSDLHGIWDSLFSFEDFDLWIDSGDFFPNLTRGDASIEAPFQGKRLSRWAPQIVSWLKGRTLISVPGNHDYVSLADILDQFGATAHDLSQVPSIQFQDEIFAGFREINYIAGEWTGETHDFYDIVTNTFKQDPTILVTHSPPNGILDKDFSGNHFGISELTTSLTYQPHRIRHHFFGHMHHEGGISAEEMGILFHNGAQNLGFVDI